MPRGYSKYADRLSDREVARLVKEHAALPRRPDGRVLRGYTSLLARKWGVSPQVLCNYVEEARRAAVRP